MGDRLRRRPAPITEEPVGAIACILVREDGAGETIELRVVQRRTCPDCGEQLLPQRFRSQGAGWNRGRQRAAAMGAEVALPA